MYLTRVCRRLAIQLSFSSAVPSVGMVTVEAAELGAEVADGLALVAKPLGAATLLPVVGVAVTATPVAVEEAVAAAVEAAEEAPEEAPEEEPEPEPLMVKSMQDS